MAFDNRIEVRIFFCFECKLCINQILRTSDLTEVASDTVFFKDQSPETFPLVFILKGIIECTSENPDGLFILFHSENIIFKENQVIDPEKLAFM